MDTSNAMVLHPSTESVNAAQGSIFFIGNATVLLRYAGFTILTDPNFLHQGEHVHLGYGLKSTRLTNPALSFEELPPFDLVILSHMHEDHFDRLVEQRLDKGIPIVTTPQASVALRRKCFAATEPLRTWNTFTVVKGDYQLRITAMPGKHGPGNLSAILPQVMGSMLEFRNAADKLLLRLYISGDTLVHEELNAIPQRYPDIDMGLFHLGGTRIFGVLLTMDAIQGVEAIKLINPREAIPIHYDEYTVMKSPIEDFKTLSITAGIQDKIRYLSHGDTYTFEVPANR